jgi:Glycosyltransferase family 10 (fucosyltransferase) C-term
VTKLNAQMTGSNLVLKRDAIARFMFNMAFENSIEDGYVTEKPFDALLAGDR